MTVYGAVQMLIKDEEFQRGGCPTNEREILDALGFEYTVKG